MKLKSTEIDILNDFIVNFMQNCDKQKLVVNWKSKSIQDIFRNILNQVNNEDELVKDKNVPKKAKNSYFLFCEDMREQTKKNNPELTNKQLLTELSRLWSELKVNNIEEYKKYEEKAKNNMNAYKQDREKYLNEKIKTIDISDDKDDKDDKHKKYYSDSSLYSSSDSEDELESGFKVYRNERERKYQKLYPELSEKEIDRKLRRHWNDLSREEKKRYL